MMHPVDWILYPRQHDFRVAVVGESRATADRVRDTLELEGMAAAVDYVGPSAGALRDLDPPPDVVLLDHPAPGAAATGAVERTRVQLPEAATLVILPELDERTARALIGAGADGLVLEDEFDAALAGVVRTVRARQISVPRPLRHLIEPPALSHREKQILGLVIAGLTNAEIATRLYLAESTVKNHLSGAFRRLGVKSRREAVAVVLASEDGLRETVLTTLRASAGAVEPGGEYGVN